MRTRIIHLINPKTDSLTTRPIYLNRALYSPLAGLLAVAASIPRDRYEVVLTDENIETIDFDLKRGPPSSWAACTRASCRRKRSGIAMPSSSAKSSS
jgi:hypothetical protein